ncbi:MAG TPA: GTP-binding protein, partial [Thiohalobacter sp.]|nr:GTP-binding protein [Thiohalobacter sp.]
MAGTTRDVLREHIQIDGMPLHAIDTAGLRETVDTVEQEGVRRAWREIEQADRLLLVIDSRQGFTAEDQAILDRLPHSLPHTLVWNKIDLTDDAPGLDAERNEVRLSATTGAGLEPLREHLKTSMGYADVEAGGFIARRRHLDAIARARQHLEQGREALQVQKAGELMAEELRLAQIALGEITGEFSSDDLLGRIFTSFCIG